MASKNVVLVDKQKNQIAPATVASQVAIDGSNVESVIHHMLLKTSLYGMTIATLTQTVTAVSRYGGVYASANFPMANYSDYQIIDFFWIVDPTRLNNDIFCFDNTVNNRVELSINNPQYPINVGSEVTFGLVIAYDADVDNAELTDLRLGADGVEYDTAGEAVRTLIAKNADEKVPYPTSSGGTVIYGTAGQALLSKGDGTTEWGAGGGGSGILWSRQDINLFQTVLQKIKYSSADAGTIVTQLINSLNAKPTDEGWTMTQIDLLDSLLDYVEYAEADGGQYADQLIDSLKGLIPTYEDVDSEEY